jgi:hypothetical protein
VCFAHPEQLGVALDVCQSFAVDNGAFIAWRKGKPIEDWELYYQWVAEVHRYPQFDFAVIPDVIDGDEEANDALIDQWPWKDSKPHVGAPVWHMHESLDRLDRLSKWPRICIGSSGEYDKVGSGRWYARMLEVMGVLCNRDGLPCCKIHGLRMLNPDVFTRFPFSSADSTNIGRNIGLGVRWKGTYTPASKEARARVMRERIEINQSPTFFDESVITDKLPWRGLV